MNKIASSYKFGMIMALSCAIIWGLLPIYWKLLEPISPSVIIVYRIFFVVLTCGVISVFLYGKKRFLEPIKDKKMLFNTIIAGILITVNWSIFLWAVNTGQIIQTSIGYYMEPLIVSFFGIFIFKEEFNLHRKIAFSLATIGVLILIFYSGEIPILALLLGTTFAIYATVKKSVNYESILGLFYETVIFAPFMLALIIYMEFNGVGVLLIAKPYQLILLTLSGIITATPLALFAIAAQNLPLISLGVTEYIAPSISLMLGIFLFHEAFDAIKFITFCFIWVALIFFTIGEVKMQKSEKIKL